MIMINMNEILNRDHRTTRSITRSIRDRLSDTSQLSIPKDHAMCYSCDYCQTRRPTSRHSLSHKGTLKLFSYYLIVVLSIYIMSSKHAEASPVPVAITSETSSGHDEVDKINFLNLKCHIADENPKLPITPLSDAVLKERLRAVLHSCHSALHQTKSLTDNYIKELWKLNVTEHHTNWKRRHISWLWPENKPLQKDFRGDIHKTHWNEILKTDWTHEKIFEYLGKIYHRFQRIGVGVQIVSKWNELASLEGSSLMNVKELNISTRLFKNATEGIQRVLCDIQAIFLDMGLNPQTDIDITPFVLDEYVKLNHWLVYREYENLMDYSHKLLKAITEEKKLK